MEQLGRTGPFDLRTSPVRGGKSDSGPCSTYVQVGSASGQNGEGSSGSAFGGARAKRPSRWVTAVRQNGGSNTDGGSDSSPNGSVDALDGGYLDGGRADGGDAVDGGRADAGYADGGRAP
jgi:hypothetical protein